MASINDRQVTDGADHSASSTVQPEISDLLGIARRGWLIIMGGTIIGLICAMMLLSTIPPVYKASSRIAFERTLARYMQTNKVTNEPIIDDYDTLGQTYVISSESILQQAIKSLSLASDPDFVGGTEKSSLSSRIRGLFRTTAKAFGVSQEQAESHRRDPEKIALDNIARDLTVTREDVPSVITIAYSSQDPRKAATIVNTIVDTYMEANLASKVSSTKVAGKVVQERIDELKQQAEDAERAILEFKAANKLVGSDQDGLSHAQLNNLGLSQVNARLAMAEAKNRMDRVAKDPNASENLTSDNALIARLRSELLDLSIRAKDIGRLVGKDHLAAIKVRTRMEEVRETIAEEQKRIAGSFEKDYEHARTRYDEVSAAVSGVMDNEGANSRVLSKLRELEKSGAAIRAQYERTLQQVSDMNRVDAQPSVAPDARILMRASPRVVSRQQLEHEVWGDVLPDSDALRSHLYALRRAIDKPFGKSLLHTLPGLGYRLSDEDPPGQ